MRYDLKSEARRARNIRRRSITLKEIAAPQMMAGDLFRASYLPVINLWAEAAKSIAAEYERTLATMTTDAPADVQAEIDRVGSAFDRLFLTLTPSLRRWAILVEKAVRQRWTRQVFSATSVDLSTRLGPSDVADTLETIIARNVALVKDVSAQIQARISDAVYRGLTSRTPARDVAKQISEAVGMGRDRSLRIASHQLSAASATLAQERRRQAGISVFEWIHSAKRFPRQEHLAHNGHYYTEDPALVGKVVNGKTIEKAPEVRPGVLPNCGCRERSVLIFDLADE